MRALAPTQNHSQTDRADCSGRQAGLSRRFGKGDGLSYAEASPSIASMKKKIEVFTSTTLARELSRRLRLNNEATLARTLRHYTNQGLLKTAGVLHTGTGRSRIYDRDALLRATVLMVLNRLQIPIGALKELLSALDRHLTNTHSGRSLTEVTGGLEDPCVFFEIPMDATGQTTARILPKAKFHSAPADRQLIVIQLENLLG